MLLNAAFLFPFFFWYRLKNDVIIEDSKQDMTELTLSNLKKSDSGFYKCKVRNSAGTVVSDPNELIVTGLYIIFYQLKWGK